MKHFSYRAIGTDGRMQRGRLLAASAADLELRLQRMELDLVTATPAGEGLPFPRIEGGLPRRELIHLCFQLEQALRAGIPIVDSLGGLRDGAGQPRIRRLLAGVVAAIEGGQTLSEALAAHPAVFDRLFVSLVRTGEAAGRLPEVLASLAETLKWRDELAAHARRIAAYPLLVGGIVLAAAVFLMLHVVPQLRTFIAGSGSTPSLPADLLFLIADALAAYWQAPLAAALAAVLAALLWLRLAPTAASRADRLKLRLPLIGGLLHKIALSRLASSLALLYAAGVPIVEAIRTAGETTGNRSIEEALLRIEQAIVEGCGLSQAFAGEKLFPPLVIRMLHTGESTGGLEQALISICYFYDRDTREAVGRMQALVEPTLTVALGLLLGWIMLAVLGPVYDIVGRIGL